MPASSRASAKHRSVPRRVRGAARCRNGSEPCDEYRGRACTRARRCTALRHLELLRREVSGRNLGCCHPLRVRPALFDPPDLGVRATVARLLHVGREQWRTSTLGLAVPSLYPARSAATPRGVARAIDRAMVRDAEPWGPLLAAIVGLAAVGALVNFHRRYATARVGVRVEARM